MKRIIILLLGIVTAIPAICQTQYVVDSAGALKLSLMKAKFRGVTDTVYASDGSEVYLLESNFPTSNLPGSKARLIIYHSPTNIKTTPAQRTQIAAYIKSVLEGTTPPDTTPVTVIDTVDNMAMTPGNGWVRNGVTTAPNWHLNTTSWSAVQGATMTYTDTFKKVGLYAERLGVHGKGQVTIKDGDTVVSSVEVDYSTTPHGLPVLIWESGTLPRKHYTVEVRNNSGTILVDFLRLER